MTPQVLIPRAKRSIVPHTRAISERGDSTLLEGYPEKSATPLRVTSLRTIERTRRQGMAAITNDRKEVTMRTQSTLGPFITLILTLVGRGRRPTNVTDYSRAKLVNTLALARFITQVLDRTLAEEAHRSCLVFRIDG